LPPAGARTRFSRIGVERANHSATGSLNDNNEDDDDDKDSDYNDEKDDFFDDDDS
jgi:hypothetical protein